MRILLYLASILYLSRSVCNTTSYAECHSAHFAQSRQSGFCDDVSGFVQTELDYDMQLPCVI